MRSLSKIIYKLPDGTGWTNIRLRVKSLIQHKELKQKQNSMTQMRKSTQKGEKKKTYWGSRGSFGMLESLRCSQSLAYTMNVVQRQMDLDALIDGLIEKISSPEGIEKLNNLKQRNEPPYVILKEAEEIVNNYLQSSAPDIYKVFFDYYGINVTQGDRNMTKLTMQVHEEDGYPAELITEEHIDEMFVHDQANLLKQLNSLYGTATGRDLLELIRGGDSNSSNMQIQIGFGMEGAYANPFPSEEAKKGELQDPEGKSNGEGVGTSIFLISEEQIPYFRKANKQKPDDSRIVLAHELIHALHAKMGVKPTRDTKIIMRPEDDAEQNSSFIGSIDLDKWIDEKMSRMSISELLSQEKAFKGAMPDDIPVTGIMSDYIIYPALLERIKHINENQIRAELGLTLREAY